MRHDRLHEGSHERLELSPDDLQVGLLHGAGFEVKQEAVGFEAFRPCLVNRRVPLGLRHAGLRVDDASILDEVETDKVLELRFGTPVLGEDAVEPGRDEIGLVGAPEGLTGLADLGLGGGLGCREAGELGTGQPGDEDDEVHHLVQES